MLVMTAASTPPPSALPPVLDPASLQRLHELDPQGTNRVVERVLRAFDTSLARLLPQARQALAQGDLEAVRHVAHTLKSSSASVGALQLSRCCAEIESLLRAQQSGDLGERLATLDGEAERVLQAVRALLPDAD
jgi:HPt (histidine-containing phosphotransfer) domain-containing protein